MTGLLARALRHEGRRVRAGPATGRIDPAGSSGPTSIPARSQGLPAPTELPRGAPPLFISRRTPEDDPQSSTLTSRTSFLPLSPSRTRTRHRPRPHAGGTRPDPSRRTTVPAWDAGALACGPPRRWTSRAHRRPGRSGSPRRRPALPRRSEAEREGEAPRLWATWSWVLSPLCRL